jgi:diacylglycerol kinase
MKPFLMGFVFAGRGLLAGWRGQRNIKVMVSLALLAVVLGWWLKISSLEWAAITLAVGLVLSLELVNTAGEKLVDLLSPEFDPRYGRVKDILAGAVLVAAIFAAIVGGVVFLPKLLAL